MGERDGQAATMVLEKALITEAVRQPDSFFPVKLGSYQPALRASLLNVNRLQSQDFRADINGIVSEGLHEVVRARTKNVISAQGHSKEIAIPGAMAPCQP